MSRCHGRDPVSGSRCLLEAAPGAAQCTACAKTSQERRAFQGWMREVALALEGSCGLSPDDLPDCPYTDWHGCGWEPDEAAAEALRLAM